VAVTASRDRSDAFTAIGMAVLVAVAAVVGGLMVGHGVVIHAGAAPLFARFAPHVGPGSLLAIAVGAALVAYLPPAASTLAWPRLVALSGSAALAWTVSLALVRGPQGITAPLTAPSEYLADLPRIEAGSLPDWLSGFAASIPATAPDPWRTHVSGHPPGLTLVFVLLDRAGLTGPWPAATACLRGWALAVAFATATVRSLAGERTARAAVPYLVLLPAVVWAGVSADAIVAGVGAAGMYLLARATETGPHRVGWAIASGLVFELACFLSYGAVLLAGPALALVAARARAGAAGRRIALALVAVVIGVLAIYFAVRWAGFDWFEGYRAVRGRYLAGYGGTRPYRYWVWADFAALAVAAGPAVAVGLRRLAGSPPQSGVIALAGGALAAVTVAAVVGLSKAEVERIWLPWTIWLPVACALIPSTRTHRWLTVQVVVALVVEHVLRTPW
jgi:methylthioxylose transferase